MFPSLYAIVDAALAGDRSLAIADALAAGGAGIIQYRNKHGSARHIFETCCELVGILRGRSQFIVNDRADIAALCGADGVHVGQHDLAVEDARGVCGRDCRVGISTHGIEQFRAANATSADYVAVGPVFSTASKENPDPVIGIEFIRQVRRLTTKPIVAIGGITLENAAAVFEAGADSVAVIRDLIAANDPAARAAQFLSLAERSRISRN